VVERSGDPGNSSPARPHTPPATFCPSGDTARSFLDDGDTALNIRGPRDSTASAPHDGSVFTRAA
jgi:hypothetical protein